MELRASKGKGARGNLDRYTVLKRIPIIEALKRIDKNMQGFVIVLDDEEHVVGVLTDGDIRRGLIRGLTVDMSVEEFYTGSATMIRVYDGLKTVIDLFKNERIKFVPIVDDDRHLVNIITKTQLHALLLQDIHADLYYDFFH